VFHHERISDDSPESERSFRKVSENISETDSSSPQIYNMGGSSSQKVKTTGGFDRLEVSLYGTWDFASRRIFDQIYEAKRNAQEGNPEDYVILPEGDRVQVQPQGFGTGFSHCKYLLKWQGNLIAIRHSPARSEKTISARVVLGSNYLMRNGVKAAWGDVMQILRSMGYQHHHETVSRADLCVDLADDTMREVQVCVNDMRLISKARKAKRFENCDKLETYQRGSGDTVIRLYDKGQEVRNDPVKAATVAEMRWGGEFKEHALRVEFQLRGKALRRMFSMSSVSEVIEGSGTIAKFMTEDWFRLCSKRVDRKNKNQSRALTSDLWLRVQEAFETWTSEAQEREPQPAKLTVDLSGLKKQAAGCVAKIAATFDDSRTWLTEFAKIAREYRGQGEQRTVEKRLALSAVGDVVHVPDEEIPF